MVKGSTLQEGIMIFNMYVPNNRTSKYEGKLIELKVEIHKSTIVIGDFITSQ